MIKLKNLLLEKKLRVFDFDDTLVKSNSKVFVINKGKKKTLTPGEFAIYKQKPGDEFDFSEFESNYINFRYLVSECYENLEGLFYELKSEACVGSLNF